LGKDDIKGRRMKPGKQKNRFALRLKIWGGGGGGGVKEPEEKRAAMLLSPSRSKKGGRRIAAP